MSFLGMEENTGEVDIGIFKVFHNIYNIHYAI